MKKIITNNLSILFLFIVGLAIAYTAWAEGDNSYLLGTLVTWLTAGFIFYKASKGEANG